MSVVEPQQQPPEKRFSPGLTVNLPTNNPFRRGQNSPSLNTPPARTPSTNPFVDSSEMDVGETTPRSPMKAKTGETDLLIKELSIEDNPKRSGMVQLQLARNNVDTPEENMPPPRQHRPSRSQEEERRRNGGKAPGRADTLDIFADPPTRRPPPGQRPRRNSDSSLADRGSKGPESEEERKRRERRHREREHRHKDSKGRPIPSNSKGKQPSRRLDVIDKLDVTSIFGTGVFHHDGPFDACNPHRNRKGSQRAPMAAFPKDSANSLIGGSGPVNKNIDLAQYHGHQPDSFKDFNSAPVRKDSQSNMEEPSIGFRGNARPGADRQSSFNATTKVDLVHGDESMGLGTSTFLEGAPAARIAIERRETEEETVGLTRKRSLAQKIRGVSNSRSARVQDLASPGVRWERTTSPEGAQSAGGLPKISEKNPFFQDYDEEYDKKGAKIQVAQEQATADDELQRIVTEGGAIATENDGKVGGGFLNRVKSLRGGRNKQRPERRE